MIKVKIQEALKNKERTKYWLSKQTKINANQIGKIVEGQTTSITFDTLDKICEALECDVCDILKREK